MSEEKDSKTKPAPKRKPDKKYLSMKRGLKKTIQTTPTLQMNADELIEVIVTMAEIAGVSHLCYVESNKSGGG